VWTHVLLLAAAGAVGTIARYGIGGLVQDIAGGSFPWGTLVINVSGCFLFGLVWTLGEDRMILSGDLRAVILIGFMGAYTTFSTFAFETGAFLRDSQWLMAFANLAGQNIIGIAALILGMALGRCF